MIFKPPHVIRPYIKVIYLIVSTGPCLVEIHVDLTFSLEVPHMNTSSLLVCVMKNAYLLKLHRSLTLKVHMPTQAGLVSGVHLKF